MGPIIRAMRHNKTRFILIVLEIAITLAIVTNAVNMILNERKEMNRPSGFDDANLVWMRMRPFAPEFREDPYMEQVIDADLRALATIPGVKAVSNTNFLPWQGGGSSSTVKVAGVKGDVVRTQNYYSTAGIFDTLGVKVVEGRGFQPGDFNYPREDEPNVAVISRALARLLWNDGGSVVGRAFQRSDASGTDVSKPFTVVGVIDQFYNPYPWPIHEFAVFFPSRVGSYARGSRFLVRVEPGAMKSVVPMLEKRLLGVNANRVFEMETMDEIKGNFQTASRLVVRLMSGVIVVLVFVTALGIVGITSLAVAERTKQIGTRRALGATRGDILRHFLMENWIVTTMGLVLGVALTYALNFALVTQVADAKVPWYLIVVGMVILWLNGLIATIPPALRAAMVSPATATRTV
jgi:putative ABC transport system permease protein